MKRALIAVVAFAAFGCYTAMPLISAPVANQELVAQLTDTGTAQLAQYLGPGVSVVNGRYESMTEDTLHLAVTSTETRRGDEHFWNRERVAIPRAVIATLSEKKLSALRSGLVLAAAVAGAFALKTGFGGSNTADKTVRPPGTQSVQH